MAWWLGIAIALSSSSKLRAEALGFGLGEVALVLMIASTVYHATKRRSAHSDFTSSMFGRFWAASILCMILGLVCRPLILADPKWSSVLHDGLALVLAIGFSIALTFLLNPYRREFAEQMYQVVTAIALLEGGLYAIGLFTNGVLPVPGYQGISLWYENVVGIRFNGICENPNQLALLLWGGPAVLSHALLTASKSRWRLIYLAGLVSCLVVGIATDSDALKVGWIVQMGVYGAAELIKAFRSRRKVPVALVLVLAACTVVTYVNPGKLVAFATAKAEQTYHEGDQGAVRLTIWKEGSNWIWASPLVGYGPGSVFTTYWNQQEAHNNFIDWALATGLIGTAVYFSLLARILVRTARGYSAFSGAMLLGVLAASSFGLSFRHPAYWFYLIMAAKMSSHAIWLGRQSVREPALAMWWRHAARAMRGTPRGNFGTTPAPEDVPA